MNLAGFGASANHLVRGLQTCARTPLYGLFQHAPSIPPYVPR